jgi:iron(III) transport system substrate-binding protein
MLVVAAVLVSAPTWRSEAVAQTNERALQAKREGTVVIYSTAPTEVVEGVMKSFEKTYGVHTEYWRAESSRLTDRVLTETRAGKPLYDVVISSDTSMLILKDAKVFAPYYPSASFRFPEEFRDKDAMLSPWRILPIGILYNSKLVKPEDVPKSYRDLLDPKWRGKIVMPDPSAHFTTTNWLLEMQRVLGADWQPFVTGLAEQRPLFVESFIVVPPQLTRGEALIGITYIKFVVDLAAEGAPIDYVRTKPMLAQGNYLALGAKAPHPTAGKLFIDYFLSKGSLMELASHGEFVLFPGILPPLKDVRTLEFTQMHPMTQNEFRRWSTEFKGIFKR